MADKNSGSDVSLFKVFKGFIQREKGIYSHLNMMTQNNMVFHGLAWCPKSFKFEK